MTNSRTLGAELQRRCDKSHEHQTLVDGRAKMAEQYPDGLCRAICRGIIKLKMERARGVRAVGEVPADPRSWHARVCGRRIDLDQFHEKEEHLPMEVYQLARLTQEKPGRDISEALAWDDLTGMRLKADKVIEARNKHTKQVRFMKVREKIPRRVAQARGWKVIKTR